MRRRDTGFTLIEILAVLTLMGVLFGLSIGLVQRAGRGNVLLQTAQSLVSHLATSREQSQGNDSAYVKVETDADGKTRIRSYRNRQVFHWACENFTQASQEDVLTREGNVNMGVEGSVSSGEGRHVEFAGGSVRLANMPDLAFTDGFNIKCRINPASRGGSNMSLFRKGDHLSIDLQSSDSGRLDVQCKIKLLPDKEGRGGGDYTVRTGFRGPEEVAEWSGPVAGGRWQDITISYDRNDFVIYVNGRLRGSRSARKNSMKPETTSPFVIGAGYMGGFDSLLISGIFEDSEDIYEIPASVLRVDDAGDEMTKELNIHFRNRSLDAQYHASPIEMIFKLNDQHGARRIVQITLSGESFIREPGK